MENKKQFLEELESTSDRLILTYAPKGLDVDYDFTDDELVATYKVSSMLFTEAYEHGHRELKQNCDLVRELIKLMINRKIMNRGQHPTLELQIKELERIAKLVFGE